MKKEVKAAPAGGADALMRAFEEFKAANDARLDALERKRGDVLLEEKVDRINRALTEQKAMLERAALAGKRPGLAADPAVSEHKSAWNAYLRRGDISALTQFESKALSVGVAADGGYLAPAELDRLIESRLRASSPMRDIATVRTTSANVFKKPISLTQAGSGWAAETGARTETTSPTLALIDFPTTELYANLAATQALLDDAYVNLEEWIASEVEDAFGAQERSAFVSGDGVNKPKGFLGYTMVADASHVWGQIGYIATGVSGGFAATDPVDKIIDLVYTPKQHFRQNARFVMNRKTVSAVRKLKDSAGQYIWEPNDSGGATLLGYAVTELEDMPDIAANSNSIAFGDFARGYLIVDRAGVRVLRDPFSNKQRGDAAELPIEARVRFIDAGRDYLIAGASARRRDNAEGGVVTIDAPLVLEINAAEAIAERALAQARAQAETLQIELGPAQLALEPGDVVALEGDAFEIVRIEDAETRRLALRRVRAAEPLLVGLAEPSAPAMPAPAPTPAASILDLPPLPNAEDDDRPLVALFASPWTGAHALYAGAPSTVRARASDPASMGELISPLWPGPVDRWDEGNSFRIRLYGGALASATEDAVLNGANAFAIEAGDGEWEIVQARSCTLVAPNEYEVSGLLRGRLGSAHAMRIPHPVGARIVLLDAALVRASIAAHEWGEALSFAAPPAGAAADDARALTFAGTLKRAALRPWAPAHLRAVRLSNGDVAVSWIRCARIGGDAWGAAEPPLGAQSEAYKLVVLDEAAPVRTVILPAPAYLYSAAEQSADFGVIPPSLRFRVMQIGDGGAEGLNTESAFTL